MSLSKQSFSVADGIIFDCYIYVVTSINGDTKFWFKAKDIAEFLGYSNTNDAIIRLVNYDWKTTWSKLQPSEYPRIVEIPPNWRENTIFISEPGVWALVSRSNKPEALRFQKWLFEEVLPTLRKNGAYVMPNASQNQINELLKLLQQKEVQNESLVREVLSLSKNNQQLCFTNNVLCDKNYKLCEKILDMKPKIAVMPSKRKLQHTIRVYKHKMKHEYVFLRPQERSLMSAVRCTLNAVGNANDYDLIFERERVPNAMNILNKVKERLNEYGSNYIAKRNVIEFDRNINLSNILQKVCDE